MIRKEFDQQTIDSIASHYRAIIELLGEDPQRDGLLNTPQRAAKAMWYATKGYGENPTGLVKQAIFDYEGSQMVIVKDIEFHSLCEHHLVPFFGHVSVGYIPSGTMVGLSKVARVVDAYARRLQVQERLTAQICSELFRSIPARGAIVCCTAQHLCMKMRGVEKQDAQTTTVDYLGDFATDASLRQEFFSRLTH